MSFSDFVYEKVGGSRGNRGSWFKIRRYVNILELLGLFFIFGIFDVFSFLYLLIQNIFIFVFFAKTAL